MIDDTVLFDLAEALLICAVHSLDTTTSEGAPDRQLVVIGTPPHDNCCDGQITASLMRQFPSSVFPEEDVTKTVCGPPYTVIHIDIEIVRCAPTQDNLGHFPTTNEIMHSSRLVAIDAQAVWAGIACCLQTHEYDWTSTMRPQEFITPEGGCVGSRLTAYVGLTNGCGCE